MSATRDQSAVLGKSVLRFARPKAGVAGLTLWIFVTAVLLYLIFPSLLVIVMSFGSGFAGTFPPHHFSFQWYHEYFTSSDWIQPTLQTMKVGALTVLVSTTASTLAALAVVRGRMPGRSIFRALVLAPVVVPAIVLAVAMYALFVRLRLLGTVQGFVMAHSVLASPYVFLVVSAGLYGIDRDLERAAASLGANRLTTFRKITLPLIAPAVAIGAALAFAISLDEVVISNFIATYNVTTLPVRMYEDIIKEAASPVLTVVAALLIYISFLLFIALGIVTRIRERRSLGH